jgi:hypothetical protein
MDTPWPASLSCDQKYPCLVGGDWTSDAVGFGVCASGEDGVFDFVFLSTVAYFGISVAMQCPCAHGRDVEGLVAMVSHGNIAVFLTVFGLPTV